MVMWKIRSCPRCGGDVFLDIDGDTYFDHCLQCGYVRRRAKKSCPQCGAEASFEIVEEGDENWYYRCCQCGYTSKE